MAPILPQHSKAAVAGESELPLLCPFETGLTPPSTGASPGADSQDDPDVDNIHNTIKGSRILKPVKSRPHAHVPKDIVQAMPTTFHSQGPGKEVLRVEEHFDQFLAYDLYLKRLNDIHAMLWMCGRPMNARPLHRQLVDDRRIVCTEQADLHLLFYSDQIMVKPLPAYLLSKPVWENHLCKDKDLHANACGLLLSYIWIVRSSLDFDIATRPSGRLLPQGLTWPEWKRIVNESLDYIDPDALDIVNKRFFFGELRLQRVNTIYRMHPSFAFNHVIRGYLYGYNRYEPFIQRNVAWFFGVSVLFSLVLSAMQVGTGVSALNQNEAFNRASFGFVVFSVTSVGVVLAFVMLLFGYTYFFNMVASISHDNAAESWRTKMKPAAQLRRQKLIEAREEKS